jgi:pimeloyl-ACP methyl ester carboxylesterase
VLMHAATGTSDVWEKQIPAFTAAGFRVIAFDRRGWGRSTTGAQAGTAADDLLALLDHLKLQRAHIIGTAAGGFVAFDFALSFSERLRSLVIANSIGGVQDPEFLELGKRLRPEPFDKMPPEFRELGPAYRAADGAGTARWIELEKHSRPDGPRSPAQPLRNRIVLADLEKIKSPTLLLTGGADLYAPATVQQMFAAHVKGAETVVVPDAGHSTYWEQPDVFNRAVLTFLRKH